MTGSHEEYTITSGPAIERENEYIENRRRPHPEALGAAAMVVAAPSPPDRSYIKRLLVLPVGFIVNSRVYPVRDLGLCPKLGRPHKSHDPSGFRPISDNTGENDVPFIVWKMNELS